MTADLGPTAATVGRVVAAVRDDQLTDPTPCTELSIAALLHHLDTLSVAFRGAAAKEPQGPAPRPSAAALGAGWRTRIPAQLDALAAAWRAPAAWEGETQIAGMRMSGGDVGVVALNEVLVHGWDLAAAAGQDYEVDVAAAQRCLDFAEQMAEHAPEMRNAIYGPVVQVPDDAPVLDRLLAQTGRDSGWKP